jgi:hypothetical protein
MLLQETAVSIKDVLQADGDELNRRAEGPARFRVLFALKS